MKKIIVILAIVISIPATVYSQDNPPIIRLKDSFSLIDNIGPCASTNPSLNSKVVVAWNLNEPTVLVQDVKNNRLEYLTPCVSVYDSLTGSRIAAFCDERFFIVDVKTPPGRVANCVIPFPADIKGSGDFIIETMTGEGFSIIKTSNAIVMGFDFTHEIWVKNKRY